MKNNLAEVPKRPLHRPFIVASDGDTAQDALARLAKSIGVAKVLEEADVIIALGGDGLMLQKLHEYQRHNLPIYGVNFGSVGFLMNDGGEALQFEQLMNRVNSAKRTVIYPLWMQVETLSGEKHECFAFNEVSLLRQTHQAAKICIHINGQVRLEELICDGVLVATPAGSTAYNLSAYGPILPIESPLLALTTISPFRPRRWTGAILPNTTHIKFTVKEAEKRPVSVTADHHEVRRAKVVEVRQDNSVKAELLFDPGHGLEERILLEQFRI